jgi:hypothetical protein
MWLAQREDLPDTHKMWADPGSALEATLRKIGYVDVPAPGQVFEAVLAELVPEVLRDVPDEAVAAAAVNYPPEPE